MNRQERIQGVARALGSQKMIWFGIRGADAQPLLALPLPLEIYSIIAPLAAVTTTQEITLELLTCRRVDADHYEIDVDSSVEAGEFWKRLETSLVGPSAVVPYRASEVLDSVCLARLGSTEYLGLARAHQAAFDSKPWLETVLRRASVPVVPRDYYLKTDGQRLGERMGPGRVVVSGEQSAGGADIRVTVNEQELAATCASVGRRLAAVGPYLQGSVPLNVNGCVFQEGAVVLYAPSLQLIGIEECTTRPLGYCGNDSCQASQLDVDCLDQLQATTVTVGQVLRRLGYVGAFGIDGLWYEGRLYVSEVNPRFQGSSWLAARIASELDLPDQFLDHIAAFLGLSPPQQVPLRELVREHGGYAQIVCHKSTSVSHTRDDTEAGPAPVLPAGIEIGLVPPDKVTVQPHGILFRVSSANRVTDTGHSLIEPFRTLVVDLANRQSAVA